MAKNERFQMIVPADILEQVRKLADTERRSISNMFVVLAMEALQARQKKVAVAETEPGNFAPAMLAA